MKPSMGWRGKAGVLGIACLPLFASSTALGAECEGDDCQGPPLAPAEVIPATAAVEGPGNPPVRFPKAHHKKHPKPKSRHQGRR